MPCAHLREQRGAAVPMLFWPGSGFCFSGRPPGPWPIPAPSLFGRAPAPAGSGRSLRLVPGVLASPDAGVRGAGPAGLGLRDAGPWDAGPPRRWRARLVFVMVALARGRRWRAASFVGTVCTVSAEPSLSSRSAHFLRFIFSAARAGGWGGLCPTLANSRREFQSCYLLKQETFAPLPSPPPAAMQQGCARAAATRGLVFGAPKAARLRAEGRCV